MLNKFSGNLMRSAVELAELWRSDKAVRKLEALMIVADKETLLIVSGTGEVIGNRSLKLFQPPFSPRPVQ